MKLSSHQNSQISLLTLQQAKKGFTLIELLVVLAIIATLASISFGIVSKFIEKGRKTESHLLATSVASACQDFKDEYGFYPKSVAQEADKFFALDSSQIEFILALTGESGVQNINEKRYLETKKAKNNQTNGIKVDESDVPEGVVDAWGNPIYVAIDYDFKFEGMKLKGMDDNIHRSVVAVSAGPDGEIGTDDDVRTWEKP